MDTNFILFSCIAVLSYSSAIFAGFGGIIIVLTLGTHLYPIKWILPVMLPTTLIVNVYILIRHHKYIDTGLLIKRILPFMSLGLVIGFALFNLLHGELLYKMFGMFVILVAIQELVGLNRQRRQLSLSPPGWLSALYIFAAGLIHGIYASGGPALVYAMNKMQLNKSVFRSTLSLVWLTTNVFLTGSYVITGRVNLMTLKFSAYLLPSVIIGVLMGELLHSYIPERTFKIAVYLLLILSGVFILLK